jgi:hypothetical protein
MSKASVAIETTVFRTLLFWGCGVGWGPSSSVTSDNSKRFSTHDSSIFGLISSQFTLSETFRISAQSVRIWQHKHATQAYKKHSQKFLRISHSIRPSRMAVKSITAHTLQPWVQTSHETQTCCTSTRFNAIFTQFRIKLFIPNSWGLFETVQSCSQFAYFIFYNSSI